MKSLLPRTALLLAAALVAAPLFAADAPPAPAAARPNSTGGNSPHETTSATLGRGGPRVTVTYGRPYAKGRKVWGQLVPWNQPWRLGSDEATTFLTQQPLTIGDKTLAAGIYTLYLVPSENEATKLAFSSALGGWGIPVVTNADVARFDLKKETLPAAVEQLTLAVKPDAATGGGTLTIAWETTQFSLPFTVKK